jgi:hypothetical protein
MEYLFYLLILVVLVSVVAGFAQSMLYPFVPIAQGQVPPAIAQELQKWGTDFQVDQIRVQEVRQRYVIDGKQGQQPFHFTINLTPDKEFANLTARRLPEKEVFNLIKPIPNGKVPVSIAERLERCFETESIDSDHAQAFLGVIGDQTAYRVVAMTEEMEYRVDLTSDGEMFYFHQKHLQR